jgi:glycerol-3-phosphate dehydrogenase
MTVSESCEVLVIGGGIHGVGVAQAAAAGGYDTILLERTALAAGTSSRSSKLIHGGLRYLESGQISLVRESLRERALLVQLATDLVHWQKFFLPVYPHTSRRPWKLRTGLSLYAMLAGWRQHSRFHTIRADQWSTLDGLTTGDLQCVLQYWDAQTNDVELTKAVMRSAESMGARQRCPASFLEASIEQDGCQVRYEAQGAVHQCRASTVVNAAGPWANRVLEKVSPSLHPLPVENVQGTHLELPGRIHQGCYYLEVPSDHRAVFVMPWGDRTLLGTTEHLYDGDPADVKPLEEERSYLLNVYEHYFPDRSREVLDAWSGLRVLPSGGKAFNRPRETQLPTDNDRWPRFVSIFGGKLTGYRVTAEKVMRVLRKTLDRRQPNASTAELPLGRVEGQESYAT